MNKFHQKSGLIIVLLSALGFIFTVAGCNQAPTEQPPIKQATTNKNPSSIGSAVSSTLIRVKWYDALSNHNWINSPPKSDTIQDIHAQLKMLWDDDFPVSRSEDEKPLVVRSCDQYFSAQQQKLEPVEANTWYIYMEAGMRCEALRIVAQSKDSVVSFIDPLLFDESLPSRLPVEIMLFVSESEQKIVLEKQKGKAWSEVEKILFFKSIGQYTAEYKTKDVAQEIYLLARGDFNNDTVEDVLLLVKSDIIEGSHTPTRLFVLTRYGVKQIYKAVRVVEM